MTMKKCVIITGASSGIGKSLVQKYSENNYNIIAVGRDIERTNLAISNVPNAIAWTGDITSSENSNEIINIALEAFGRIDVLINNAGIIYRYDAINTTDDQWNDSISTNLSAPFYLSRAALPALIESKGSIVNIASDWGLKGGANALAYCASKGGLVLMTKAMALDHAADGVNINAICPGDVDTPMLEIEAKQRNVNYDQAMIDNNLDSPTGRITMPYEVASLAYYLSSDMSAQITGTTVSIDGGNTA
jgi:NAD(P)-dependent dehydrogenase (short-subunit alcohol dehydrogenase family)